MIPVAFRTADAVMLFLVIATIMALTVAGAAAVASVAGLF